MTWSYSRINSWIICPRSFYYIYVEEAPRGSNFFSEYGSFIHEIMEKFGKGQLEIWDLVDYYESNYTKNVVSIAPPNEWVDLNVTYFEKGLNFLSNFRGFRDKTIGIEQRVNYKLGGKYSFVGYIDRIGRDINGKLNISDYKSKKSFKDAQERDEYFRQLYLYAHWVNKKYGEFPEKLYFNMFRSQRIEEERFSAVKYKAALDWAISSIGEILKDEHFIKRENEFFCENLCSCAERCKGE